MVRRTMKLFLAALVAAFTLSSIAEAAPARVVRHRTTTKRSASNATAGAKRKATMKRTTHKRTAAKARAAAPRRTVKRTPTTKPR